MDKGKRKNNITAALKFSKYSYTDYKNTMAGQKHEQKSITRTAIEEYITEWEKSLFRLVGLVNGQFDCTQIS